MWNVWLTPSGTVISMLPVLYVFDSCPYCTRSRAMAALKNFRLQTEFLSAADIQGQLQEKLREILPAGPADSLLTVTVPVLLIPATEDQPARLLTDSQQIIEYFDRSQGYPLFQRYLPSSAVQADLSAIRPLLNRLCYPRMPALQLAELADSRARQHLLTALPERLGMTATEALQQTRLALQQLQPLLNSLVKTAEVTALLSQRRTLLCSDLQVFADLRNLTMVAGLEFPAALQNYFNYLSKLTGLCGFPAVDQHLSSS